MHDAGSPRQARRKKAVSLKIAQSKIPSVCPSEGRRRVVSIVKGGMGKWNKMVSKVK